MSGVSVEKKPVHYCGAPTRPGDKPFVYATVGFNSEEQRPIVFFNASGTFVSGESEAVRKLFKEKSYSENDIGDKERYWTDQDALKCWSPSIRATAQTTKRPS